MKSVAQFSFNRIDTLALCARVHDGDTITVLFKFHDEYVQINLRLSGLDAPELHSQIEAEAEASRLGQQYLSQLILNNVIRMQLGGQEKFGRTLATIYTVDTNENINELMLEKGFARSYGVDGNLHKAAWTEEELNKAKQSFKTLPVDAQTEAQQSKPTRTKANRRKKQI